MKKIVFAVGLLATVLLSGATKQLAYDTTSDNFKTKISLSVVDKGVDIVLDQIADLAGVNLVQGEETKSKKLSMTLNDIPMKDALDLIIRATDLSYQILDNSVIVASSAKVEREIGQVATIFDLQYADAKSVVAMLSDVTKKVQVDERGNRVIYQANPKVAKEIEKILTRIDRPMQQVLFKAVIKEIGTNNESRYGLDWGKISNYRTTIREGSYVDWGDWKYTDPTETAPGKWTFGYNPSAVVPRDLSGDNEDTYNVWDRPANVTSQTSSLFNPVWHRVISQSYDLSFDFKLADGEATVIAQPEIATLNNVESYVHIGDRVPYVVTSIEQGSSKQNVNKEEVGVKLKIKPIINEENDITVALDAEVSSIFDWKGPNQEIPWVKVRKANTTVRVKDGQTITVGGMMLEDVTTSVSKLPLLGQIPYIGILFSNQVQTKKKTNLVIEVTPYIMVDGEVVRDEEETDSEE